MSPITDEAVEAMRRLVLSAKVLLQNAEGCAANHYGDDFALYGEPGWIADCRRDIESAERALSAIEPTPDAAEELEVVGWGWINEPHGEFVASHANQPHPANAEPLVLQSAAQAIIEKLRAENEVAENYLRDLLTSFVTEHFPNNESWKPLPDLLGMLSQMDNASTVARDYKARLAEAVKLLIRLGTWIEDEVNAELPFVTEAEDDAYRTFLQSLGKEG